MFMASPYPPSRPLPMPDGSATVRSRGRQTGSLFDTRDPPKPLVHDDAPSAGLQTDRCFAFTPIIGEIMTQAQKAETFAALHVPGDPVVLYNIWDAGGATALAKAGAPAVATGSWSVAAAQGYGDGEAIPLDFLVRIVERITASVDVPVSVDFEGAYAVEPQAVAGNVRQLLDAGAIGINFEDQIVGGSGLHALDKQVDRIAAIRQAAEIAGVPLFINARTDLFLKDRERADHEGLVAEALERGAAYAEAGASGFFVPWLADPDLIGEVCGAVPVPVNIMVAHGVPPKADLAALGVARISHGPGPYIDAIKTLGERYQSLT